jgi:hypothetical protein
MHLYDQLPFDLSILTPAASGDELWKDGGVIADDRGGKST